MAIFNALQAQTPIISVIKNELLADNRRMLTVEISLASIPTDANILAIEVDYDNAIVAADSPIEVSYNGDCAWGSADIVQTIFSDNYSLGQLNITLSKLAQSAAGGISNKVMTVSGIITENVNIRLSQPIFKAKMRLKNVETSEVWASQNPVIDGVLRLYSQKPIRAVAIYSLDNRLIYTAAINETLSTDIPLPKGLNTGLYIVQVRDISGAMYAKKVVILSE